MVPQNFKNNEVIWKGMEIMLRKYVMRHQQGVYIITGPIYNSSTPNVLGKNKVWIPDMLFKIAIDVQTGHSIAFLLPNKAIQIADLPKYVTNLTTIENKTGIRFDSSVNKLLTATYQDWTN
jgi:DNA/RNA endonuclease G (NUC1)